MSVSSNNHKYIILGAGCSGLSLCYYLLEQGVDAPILLLDSRTTFPHDRTWCFWDVEPHPFSHLATHRWESWTTQTDTGLAHQTSTQYPYLYLPSHIFYEHTLNYLRNHDNVTLRLGEAVTGYTEQGCTVSVETSHNQYTGEVVFDGRGIAPQSPLVQQAKTAARWIPQHFIGWFIRTKRPVFDEQTVTLMDFRLSQAAGIHFEYVLPFSAREALVENVYMAQEMRQPEQHRQEIASYLQEKYGLSADDYTITHTEQGYIPMTDFDFPKQFGQRIFNIGMLGGQTRPSSGYTFTRIQRYCRQLAASAIQNELPIPSPIVPYRLDWLDSIFLRFMVAHPKRCPEVFRRMFANVPSDVLIRFLSDHSSPLDEARLIAALPKLPFMRIVLQTLYDNGRANFGYATPRKSYAQTL